TVVGGIGFTTHQFALAPLTAQQGSPAARAGVAQAGAIGVDFNSFLSLCSGVVFGHPRIIPDPARSVLSRCAHHPAATANGRPANAGDAKRPEGLPPGPACRYSAPARHGTGRRVRHPHLQRRGASGDPAIAPGLIPGKTRPAATPPASAPAPAHGVRSLSNVRDTGSTD